MKDPAALKFLSEKLKKEQAESSGLRKMRQDLLEKERLGIVKLPQKKRSSRPEAEEGPARRAGVRVGWSKTKVFTEPMIVQCFEKYGKIAKVEIEGSEACLVFENEMASVGDM